MKNWKTQDQKARVNLRGQNDHQPSRRQWMKVSAQILFEGWLGGKTGPRPLGPKGIDGLLVPPGKAYDLPSDYMVTSLV